MKYLKQLLPLLLIATLLISCIGCGNDNKDDSQDKTNVSQDKDDSQDKDLENTDSEGSDEKDNESENNEVDSNEDDSNQGTTEGSNEDSSNPIGNIDLPGTAQPAVCPTCMGTGYVENEVCPTCSEVSDY